MNKPNVPVEGRPVENELPPSNKSRPKNGWRLLAWLGSDLLRKIIRSRRRIASTILASVPGTAQFRRQYQLVAIKQARHYRTIFEGLKSINNQEKQQLRKMLRQHINQFVIQVVKRGSIELYNAGIIGMIITFIGVMIVPQIAFLILGMKVDGLLLLSSIFAYIICISLIMGPLFVALFSLKRFSDFSRLFLIIIWPSFVSIFLVALFYRTSSQPVIPFGTTYNVYMAIFSGTFGAVISYVSFYVSAFLNLWYKRYTYRRMLLSVPHQAIVCKLLVVLSQAETALHVWNSPKTKRLIMSRLEEIAQCIEKGLPHQLQTGDIIVDRWTRERAVQMAAAVRSLKTWICMPREDTKMHFTTRIKSDFINAIFGWWDYFETTEPNLAYRTTPWQMRAISFLHSIMLALLPLITFQFIQRTSLALPPPMSEYVTIAVGSWALLTLLASLDPLFGNKVTALKDVLNSLPFFGKGGP